MRRTLVAAVACLLALAGCGGGPHLAQDPPAGLHAPRAITAPASTSATQSAMGSVAPAGWGAPLSTFGLTPPTPAQTAEMYDDVNLSLLPAGAHWLAGYANGIFANAVAMAKLSWHPHVTTVAVSANGRAQCGDFEPGDMTPAQAPAWYRADKAAGFAKPCIYSSIWEFVHQIIPTLNAAHIARSSYWAWDADYTFVRHLDAGFDATQWTDRALGRSLDESTATLAFLGATPPQPKPNPLLLRWRGALAATNRALVKVNAELASLNRTHGVLTQRQRYFTRKIATATK